VFDKQDLIIRESTTKIGRTVLNKLYRVFCDTCNAKMAYRPISSKKNHICSSCQAKTRFIDPTNNPMFGKKHINKERFRKNTFNNVNYEDTVIHYTKHNNKLIKYRQSCPMCGADLGYRRHIDAQRKCVPCQGVVNTKNSKIHRQLRASMKAA